jgi:adenylyltransferase and sulfurtransferase
MSLDTLITRYSRQMLLPEIGIQSQTVYSQSKVTIIGAGGIGSTVIMYLAGAGIGKIHIIEDDFVEESNLHRQIIHSSSSIQQSKAKSAQNRVLELNPHIQVIISECRLVASTALELLADADVVVDATDNFSSRYVINDACVLLNKPLVSGSAVGLEGQIIVIQPYETACYRCLYPQPSIADTCRTCENAGVLGPVPGLIGCLQAIEVIKLLSKKATPVANTESMKPLYGRQLFYDGLNGEFHTFHLPARSLDCSICSEGRKQRGIESSIVEPAIPDMTLQQLPDGATITAKDYADKYFFSEIPHILLDVRSDLQYNMIDILSYYRNHSVSEKVLNKNIQGLHISLKALSKSADKLTQLLQEPYISNAPIFVLCRRGIDSMRATSMLLGSGYKDVVNVDGGLTAWKSHVEPTFPAY